MSVARLSAIVPVLAMLGVASVCVASLTVAPPGAPPPLDASAWLPADASTAAAGVDGLFRTLLIFAGACLVLLMLAVDLLLYRYRRNTPEQMGKPNQSRTVVTAALVIGSSAVVAAVFLMGFWGFLDTAVAPADAFEIDVEGKQWGWTFQYSEDFSTHELHVPANRPVKLNLQSVDVVHGLTIPAFRVQQIAMPGQPTSAWFEATEPGEYRLYGSEYNGAKFDSMVARVIVHEPMAFDTWLDESANILDTLPPVDAGRILVQRNGCLVCHSLDGTPGTAPTFAGVVGRTQSFTDGSSRVADDVYLKESILASSAKVVAGYQPLMPDFSTKLSEREVEVIIEYLKSLSTEQEEG